MYYYKYKNHILISNYKYDNFETITEYEAKEYYNTLYFLNSIEPLKSRRSFIISCPGHLFLKNENINILDENYLSKLYPHKKIPSWIIKKIHENKIVSINTKYPTWKNIFDKNMPHKWKINVVGLGDVGGTLITDLRLLGCDCIKSIGIFDKNTDKISRWNYEVNQILSSDMSLNYPDVIPINENELFNCDMFVFCVSVGVPKIGQEKKDVRLVQFEGNSKIIKYYAQLARNSHFKGIFSVISDPVDLLCKSAFLESNKNTNGNYDFKGLAPEQIRGYGLGVMNARAAFYAKQNKKTSIYLKEGRAFGPHGEGLIIADSIQNYNDENSILLTEKSKKANLDIRAVGFKPYIAPALSSGSLSLISTIKSQPHYSCTFIGGTFMGARNTMLNLCTKLETYNLPEKLLKKLKNTYDYLNGII